MGLNTGVLEKRPRMPYIPFPASLHRHAQPLLETPTRRGSSLDDPRAQASSKVGVRGTDVVIGVVGGH